MEPVFETRESLIKSLDSLLRESISLDSWGQIIEASQGYRMLSRSISEAISYSGQFSFEEKKELERSREIIQERSRQLESTDLLHNFSDNLDGIKSIILTLEQLRSPQANAPQPVLTQTASDNIASIPDFQESTNSTPTLNQDITGLTGGMVQLTYDAKESHGNLLPAPPHQPGMSYLTVDIEKMGVKDAHSLTNPFVAILAMNRLGHDLSKEQSTPITHSTEKNLLIFDQTVHIQNSLQSLDKEGGIYFLLKHFKPNGQKISTKCFSILELDEIQNGPIALEIYRKPVEFRKKKLTLLSVKPLYLHLTLHVNIC